MLPLAHQRQFILGAEAVQIRPDWVSVALAERLVLSHCPKLAVERLRSSDGVEHFLLGIAVLADERDAAIADLFPSKHSCELEEWTAFWAGRWALISKECCIQDASGCIGIYHRSVGDDVWISSSPALLGDHLPNAPSAPRIPWRISHEAGIDWIPIPLSTREDVYKLLPQRVVDPKTAEIRPLRATLTSGPSLAEGLTTILANWGRCSFPRKLVGLTAGLDTRTILAAAVAARTKCETYTSGMLHLSGHDRDTPPKLAARVNLWHRPLSGTPVNPAEIARRRAVLAEHMDGASYHPIFGDFVRGELDFSNDPGTTVAGGHTFEVGRCFYWDILSEAGFDDSPPSADILLELFFPVAPEPIQSWLCGMTLWLDSISDPVPLNLDWRDRFYLEQRLGSWNSTTQRVWDMLDGTWFYAGNCLWIFHQLLQPDPRNRTRGVAQKEVIRLLAPELAGIPFNSPVKAKLKMLIRAMIGRKRAQSLKRLGSAFRISVRRARAKLGRKPGSKSVR